MGNKRLMRGKNPNANGAFHSLYDSDTTKNVPTQTVWDGKRPTPKEQGRDKSLSSRDERNRPNDHSGRGNSGTGM